MIISKCDDLLAFIASLETMGPHYYRGYKNSTELISSLGRKGGNGFSYLKEFAVHLEQCGLTDFKFKQLIALGQHYGLPTNLIDLTTDPLVSIFFGLGREKTGRFHILYAQKDYFDSEHSAMLRKYMTHLADIGEFTLGELEPLMLSQIDEMSDNTIVNLPYVQSKLFERLYNRFFEMQFDYTLVPYEKDSDIFNIRVEAQKGLFILSKEASQSLPLSWFDRVDVQLNQDEVECLNCYLSERAYTSYSLLPPTIKGVDVESVARDSVQRVQALQHT